MNRPQRFADLWTDYLEGELDESGMAELRDLLAADEGLLQLAVDTYQTHRLLGMVAEDGPSRQDAFVRDVLAKLPKESDSFVSGVMAGVLRAAETDQPEPAQTPAEPRANSSQPSRIVAYRGVVAALAATILAVVGYSLWPTGDATQQSDRTDAEGPRFTSLAHARFFGELLPPVGSTLQRQRDYVLMGGMVELGFPAGATAIIEGPAVFRVLSDESLALDVGRCSVHAPGGAEGFLVETPVTRVVDRGTRFTVSVAETSETEVQVIEGAADVYDPADAHPDHALRLLDGEARKFAKGPELLTDNIPFDARIYRRDLPDRVISYEATTAADGGGENLISVTVQRGGRLQEIPVEDLNLAHVTAFKTTAPGAFVCGGPSLPERRVEWATDRSLVTGVINPGGSREPLTSDPVLAGELATPGMAVRFASPVENGPGPDVVLFDLQTLVNPTDGDPFHVSPLSFRPGLKSHTVRGYDLTMESPHARELTDFSVHMFAEPATSLDSLESLACSPRPQIIKFRGLAVGIDLSDLGYAAGELVEGLFLQDALDDEHHIDPVLIGGLPPMQ